MNRREFLKGIVVASIGLFVRKPEDVGFMEEPDIATEEYSHALEDVSTAAKAVAGSLEELADAASEEDLATAAEVLGSMRIQYVTPASNHKCEICGRPAQHHLHDMREVKSEGEYRMWEHVGPAHSYCDEHISKSDPRDGLVKAWT